DDAAGRGQRTDRDIEPEAAGAESQRGDDGAVAGSRRATVWEGNSMSRIVRVDLVMVDLKPKVKRVDAIQSFVSQETPIVRITDADGVVGTGYSYTIGTGGHSVMALLERTLGPAIIGDDANDIVKIWKKLLFLSHATTVGAI